MSEKEFLIDDFKLINIKPEISESNFSRSIWQNLYISIRENKIALLCVSILIIITLMSIFAFLSPYDPDKMNMSQKLQRPSREHIFGTDNLGRDYFTRALYGGRVSLTVGVVSMLVSVIVGTLYGTISGYIGGFTDVIMMRFVDIFMSVPSFLLIIIINTFVSPSITTMIIIIGIFSWMGLARIVRAEAMSLKQRDFILAAKNLGDSNFKIIFVHIIPNMIPSIIVAATISIARAILTESSLSFLGFGVKLPMSSWGSMLQNAQGYILDMPFLAVFPGLLILLTVLSFNVLGDVLRNALEPRSVK